jgi:hypothetical protein
MPQQGSPTRAEIGVGSTHRPLKLNQSAFSAAKCKINADANFNLSGNSSARKPELLATSVGIAPGWVGNARTFGLCIIVINQNLRALEDARGDLPMGMNSIKRVRRCDTSYLPHTFPIRGAVTTTVLLNDGKLTGQS